MIQNHARFGVVRFSRRFSGGLGLGLAAALLLTFGAAAPARAAGAKRVGIPKFDGAQEAVVRKEVMRVVGSHGFELAKSREMETGLQSSGASLESDDGFQKVAKELALSAIVTGEVGKKKVKLSVHDGRDGSLLGEASFAGGNPKKIAWEVGRSFWGKLGDAVGKGHVPSGAKKPQKGVAEAAEDSESSSEGDTGAGAGAKSHKDETVAQNDDSNRGSSDDGGGAPSVSKKFTPSRPESEEESAGAVPPTLEISGAPMGLNRSLSFNQDISSTRLAKYSLPMGAEAAVRAVWYPIASLTSGAIQHLGVELSLEQGIGIQSDTGSSGGATYGTTVHDFSGGLRYRIPFGLGSQAWISATGGEQAFVFRTTDSMYPRSALDTIPDVIYRYIRPGVGARFQLGEVFSVTAGLGYRVILNGAGPQFGDFFPHATVGGVDADVYVGWRVVPNVDIRAGADLRRYFFSMNSQANDPYIAGGAIDQYFAFSIGAAFLYGGNEHPAVSAAGGEDSEGAPAKKKAPSGSDDSEGGSESGGDASGGGGGDSDK